MNFIDSVTIDSYYWANNELELSNAEFPADPDTPVDYMIVSSKPRLYDPAQGGWPQALAERGVSMAALESDCAQDFRPQIPCWISQPVESATLLGFERLVVFEPEWSESPESPASEAARQMSALLLAVLSFAGRATPYRIAMPLLATEFAGVDERLMMRTQFYAAASLGARAPAIKINIVVPDRQLQQAAAAFGEMKTSYLNPPIAPPAWQALIEQLKKQYPDQYRMSPLPEGWPLTPRQHEAIWQYSIMAYVYANEALRTDDIADERYATMHAFIEATSSGLSQLKNYNSDERLFRVFRAFPGSEEMYQDGKVAVELAYTSTSTRLFTFPQHFSQFRLLSRLGKYIGPLSAYPEEDEVLFDFKMNHGITDRQRKPVGGDGYIYTTDEQISNSLGVMYSHL